MVKLPISLSSGFFSVVKVNDYVKSGQVIATKAVSKEYVITVPKDLSVSPVEARKYLKKSPGDTVKIGDILAVKKSFMGLNEEKIVSRVDGVILRYERDTGNLVIKVGTGEEEKQDIISPIDGTVVVCNNEMIAIGTERDVCFGTKGVGKDATGEIFIFEGAFLQGGERSDSNISLYYTLDSRAVGKIVVGNSFSRDLLIKSIGMGVKGIVGTKISDEDIEYLFSRHMMVPILEVDDITIRKIIQWKGKKIYLNSPEKHVLFLHA